MPESVSFRCDGRLHTGMKWNPAPSDYRPPIEIFEPPANKVHGPDELAESVRQHPVSNCAIALRDAGPKQAPDSDLHEASAINVDAWCETAKAIARSLSAPHGSAGGILSTERLKEVAALSRMLADLVEPRAEGDDLSWYEDDRPHPVVSTRDLTGAEEEMLRAIDETYEVRDREDVREFLRKFPFLLSFLIDMRRAITSTYGDNTSVTLDAWTLMKRTGLDDLLVDIRSPFDEDTAFERYVEFQEAWWFDHANEAHGLVTILC